MRSLLWNSQYTIIYYYTVFYIICDNNFETEVQFYVICIFFWCVKWIYNQFDEVLNHWIYFQPKMMTKTNEFYLNFTSSYFGMKISGKRLRIRFVWIEKKTSFLLPFPSQSLRLFVCLILVVIKLDPLNNSTYIENVVDFIISFLCLCFALFSLFVLFFVVLYLPIFHTYWTSI